MEDHNYIPALGFYWLTKIYDPVVTRTTREMTFKVCLIETARAKSGEQVLDVGCGTGTLAILLKQSEMDLKVFGLDGDIAMLTKAKSKAAKANLDIRFDHGLSYDLPYGEASFDHVFSTLFFHHLTWDNKLKTLREVWRVLKPGGRIHIADWGKAANPLMRFLFYGVQLLDGFEATADNVKGRLPKAMEEAGFEDVFVATNISTMFGTLSPYGGIKTA